MRDFAGSLIEIIRTHLVANHFLAIYRPGNGVEETFNRDFTLESHFYTCFPLDTLLFYRLSFGQNGLVRF